MQLVFDYRASSILYLFLLENKGKGKWMIPTNVCHFIPACFIKSNCPFEIIDVNLDTLRMCEQDVISRLVKDGKLQWDSHSKKLRRRKSSNCIF